LGSKIPRHQKKNEKKRKLVQDTGTGLQGGANVESGEKHGLFLEK